MWDKIKGLDICSLFNEACTKYSTKCVQQFPYDPQTWRVAQDFHKAPFLYWNSPKTLQKISKIFIRSVIRHFSTSEKIPSFGDRIAIFSQYKFPPNVHAVSLGPDGFPLEFGLQRDFL